MRLSTENYVTHILTSHISFQSASHEYKNPEQTKNTFYMQLIRAKGRKHINPPARKPDKNRHLEKTRSLIKQSQKKGAREIITTDKALPIYLDEF